MKKEFVVTVLTNEYVADGSPRKRAEELAKKAVQVFEDLGLVYFTCGFAEPSKMQEKSCDEDVKEVVASALPGIPA